MSDAYPGSGYRADEFYRPGGWTNEYVGKTYGMSDTKLWGPKDTPGAVNHGYELFTMGMVGIMFGNHDPWADADLRRYVLGILGIV